MEQLTFINPQVLDVSPASQPVQTRLALPGWFMPAANNDTARLWQHFALLQTRLSGISRRRNGQSYKGAQQQLSRLALLLLPGTPDLALASILLNCLVPGHLAIGQAQVRAKAQHVSGQSLATLDDLDERGLMQVLMAVYGEANCQAVVDYINQRLASLEGA